MNNSVYTRSLTAAILTIGILAAGAPVAQARPVIDPPIQPGDCGPGLSDTVFSLTAPGGTITTCRSTYLRPSVQKPSVRPGLDHWWNPWSWFA